MDNYWSSIRKMDTLEQQSLEDRAKALDFDVDSERIHLWRRVYA